MLPDPNAQQALTAHVKKTLVRSYDEPVWRGAWLGRTRGLWTGVAVGLAFDALFGAGLFAVAALCTAHLAIAGLAGGSLLLASMGTFAVAGMFFAMPLSADVGVQYSVAEGLRELEARLRSPGLEQALQQTPEGRAQLTAIAQSREEKHPRWWNPRVMASAVLLGLGVGAAVGLVSTLSVPLAPVIAIAQFLGTSSTIGTVAATNGFFGAFSALFGVNMPLLTSRLSDRFGRLLTGRVFEPAPAPVSLPIQSPTPLVSIAEEPPALSHVEALARQRASDIARQR